MQEPRPRHSLSSGGSVREAQVAGLHDEQATNNDSFHSARFNVSSNINDREADYHEGISSINILSEALGGSTSNNLAERILRQSPGELSELDDVDAAYLRRKGVYNIPISTVW